MLWKNRGTCVFSFFHFTLLPKCTLCFQLQQQVGFLCFFFFFFGTTCSWLRRTVLRTKLFVYINTYRPCFYSWPLYLCNCHLLYQYFGETALLLLLLPSPLLGVTWLTNHTLLDVCIWWQRQWICFFFCCYVAIMTTEFSSLFKHWKKKKISNLYWQCS